MYRIPRMSVVLALAVAVPLLLAGCGGGQEAEQEAERESRLAELEDQKQELDAAREELAAMEERLRQARAGELPEGEEVNVTELQSEIDRRDADIADQAEEWGAALVEFINSNPPVEGEPMTEVQKRALALKVEEDLVLAEEHITEGGDYAQAIRIYENILTYSPGNEKAEAALAEAQARRYMDEERFSQVEEGMTQGDVVEILGPVNLRNRREFPEQGVVAWYYPKSEARDAAGVFFRQRDGRWVVFRTDFDYISKEGDEAGS